MQRNYRRNALGEKWILVILVIALLAPSVNTKANKVYQWVDEQGEIHYGDTVPPNTGAVQEIVVPAAPAADPDIHLRKQRTERLLRSFQQERAEKYKTRQAAARERKKRQANCEQAKKSQYKHEHSAYLYSIDEDGNRVILGDEQYARAMAKVRADVKKWCG